MSGYTILGETNKATPAAPGAMKPTSDGIVILFIGIIAVVGIVVVLSPVYDVISMARGRFNFLGDLR